MEPRPFSYEEVYEGGPSGFEVFDSYREPPLLSEAMHHDMRREDLEARPRPRRGHRGPAPGFGRAAGFKPAEAGLLRPSVHGRLHTVRMTNRY